MHTDVRLFKLTNGEDIIAQITENNSNTYSVNNPLLMKVHTRVTNDGIQEGLHLSRWLQPFCDVTDYTIQKHSIVISVPASVGLSRYYEYVLKKIDSLEIKKPTKSDIRKIQKSEVRNKLDKLKKDLAELEIDGETIH